MKNPEKLNTLNLSSRSYDLWGFWNLEGLVMKNLFFNKKGLPEQQFSSRIYLQLNRILQKKAMQLELRPALFWDVNVEEVDLQKHSASVIERISTRGRLDEFRDMVKFYGRETVKTTLLNARYLDKRTLSYCSLIFDVPITEFRCYKLAQLNPEHWIY